MSVERPSEHDCPLCGSPLVCWPLSATANGTPLHGIFVGVEVRCNKCEWQAVLRPYHLADAAVAAYRGARPHQCPSCGDQKLEVISASGGGYVACAAKGCHWTQSPSDDRVIAAALATYADVVAGE